MMIAMNVIKKVLHLIQKVNSGVRKIWNLQEMFFRKTNRKYWFDCDVCGHEFLLYISHACNEKDPNWCPYCQNTKLCEREDCIKCFEKSFASQPKVKYWSSKNKVSPRTVFRRARGKYWFDCDVCGHEFLSSLCHMGNNLAANYSCCPYCESIKLCNKDECTHCFEKSFASNPKSKFWSKKNTISPREVFKHAQKKYWFNCDECNYEFCAPLYSVSKKIPIWCPICKNKTEKILYRFLDSNYSDVVFQYIPSWCRSPLTGCLFRYDYFIPSLNVIIELDGDHHFHRVMNWGDPRIIQSKDLFKMKMAYDRGISIIRIPHNYILSLQYFKEYSEKLQKAILKSREFPEVIYLCENPEAKYQHFHSFDFEKDGIPPILSIGDI
jgi:hypothetical protein